MPESESRVKLPKIDVLTFDGNIIHWSKFWEQLEVSIHSKTHLRNVEKLAYLRHALTDGPALQPLEGLSRPPISMKKPSSVSKDTMTDHA